MSVDKKLVLVQKTDARPGFLGAGHEARAVVQRSFKESDPFILLMDDYIDKQDELPAGGPHPHAGFETVTLMLEGELDGGEHVMQPGDLELMTAGSGTIHSETITKKARLRILQLWLNLPKKDRWTKPRVQDIAKQNVPHAVADGTTIRLYSGSLDGMVSPLLNYTPLLIADITMESGVTKKLEIPSSYNGFLYVLEGSVHVGSEAKLLQQNEVGWISHEPEDRLSSLHLESGGNGVRLVLYAGEPQGDPIVSHGPFIADTTEDICRLFREFRSGKMAHIAEATGEQKIIW